MKYGEHDDHTIWGLLSRDRSEAVPVLAVWDCVDAQFAGYPMPRQEKTVRRTSHIQEFVKV